MNAASAKRKGKELEEYVAREIRQRGLDPRAERDGASGAGNREKGDIQTNLTILRGEHAHIECKNHRDAAVTGWWRQACEDADRTHAEPIVVYKLGGESMIEAKAVLRLDTLLDLLVEAKGIKIERSVDLDTRDLRRQIEAVTYAAQKLAKLAEEEKPNPRYLAYARQNVRQAATVLLRTLEQYNGS